MGHKMHCTFVVLLVGCSGSDGAPPNGLTMTGSNAFAVTSTVMLTKALHCTSGALPSGELDALTVVAADVDLSSTSCPSGGFDLLPHVLELEVATGGYFTSDPGSANQPIVAGTTFSILNEHVSDENLCGNVPGGTTQPTAIAILNECPSGSPCSVNYFASAGSIKVSTVSPTSVAGTFDLTLVNTDGEAQGTLSGSFDASTCP
jgi:hypothetical protein